MSAFCTSQEAFSAEDLFTAYRSGAAEGVKAAVAKPMFKTIDIQVRREGKPQPLLLKLQCDSGRAAELCLL